MRCEYNPEAIFATQPGNEYPPEVLAEKISETVAGVKLDKATKQKYGNAVHWGYGIMWGALFGALRDRAPLVGRANEVGFGTRLWLAGDEVMMPLMGLSPPSTKFLWQNHARAATNHIAYGATLGITHSLLRKLSDENEETNVSRSFRLKRRLIIVALSEPHRVAFARPDDCLVLSDHIIQSDN